jgi:hypothetical protein
MKRFPVVACIVVSICSLAGCGQKDSPCREYIVDSIEIIDFAAYRLSLATKFVDDAIATAEAEGGKDQGEKEEKGGGGRGGRGGGGLEDATAVATRLKQEAKEARWLIKKIDSSRDKFTEDDRRYYESVGKEKLDQANADYRKQNDALSAAITKLLEVTTNNVRNKVVGPDALKAVREQLGKLSDNLGALPYGQLNETIRRVMEK